MYAYQGWSRKFSAPSAQLIIIYVLFHTILHIYVHTIHIFRGRWLENAVELRSVENCNSVKTWLCCQIKRINKNLLIPYLFIQSGIKIHTKAVKSRLDKNLVCFQFCLKYVFAAGLSPKVAYLYHLLNESFFEFLRGFQWCFLCTNSKKILPPAVGAPPQTPSGRRLIVEVN